MELLHRRCCGLDVHKETVVACLRLVSDGKVTTEVRTFKTTTADLLHLSAMTSSSTPPGRAKSASASCLNRNGPCSSPTTTKASSIGALMRPIAPGSPPTPIHNHISRVSEQ